MNRPVTITVLILMFAALESLALGDESIRSHFDDFVRVMDGEWVGNIVLYQDTPGIGKKGQKMTVRWVFTVTQKGNALVGNGSDGQGTAGSFTHYDVEKKQIRAITVFSGGTAVSSVVTKQNDHVWRRKNVAVDPDGTKTESDDTLVISDGGDTHTWTRGGVSNVWRRTRK